MSLSIFQQSVFLQSLGWAIANSIWQGGLVWIAFHIFGLCYSRASARFKNAASTILLFAAFLWFIETFLARLIYLQNNLYNSSSRPFLFSIPLYPAKRGLSVPGFSSYLSVILPYLSVAYLFLLLIFTVKLINACRVTNSIKHNGLQKPPVDWRLFVEKVTMHIGIHKKVKLWFSVYVDVPATIGFLKPVILIPVASLNQLTVNQLEAIILHELSHIKRNDYLVNMLISLIETILFFNPFIALLSGIIKKERENCCDDFVLEYQYDRHSYASALLCLEKHRDQHYRLALTATSGEKQLLLRIKRIIDLKNANNTLNYGQKLLALLVLTGFICSVAWLSPAGKAGHPPVQKKISPKYFNAISPKRALRSPLFFAKQGYTAKIPLSSAPKIAARDEPVITAPLIQPQNDVEEKQENSASYNINGRRDTGIAAVRHKPQVSPEQLTKKAPQTFLQNGFSLPVDFSVNASSLLNIALDVDLHRVTAEIKKNSEAIAKIKWDGIGKDIQEVFERFKIAGVKIGPANAQSLNLQFNLDKLKPKNIPIDLEQLINTLKDMAGASIKCSPEQLLRDKAINFLIDDNPDKGNLQFRKSDKRPSSPQIPPKKHHNSINVPPPAFFYDDGSGSENTDSNDDVKGISSDRALLTQSLRIMHKEKQVIINEQKTYDLQAIKRSQRKALTKKLLLVLNKQMAMIQVED